MPALSTTLLGYRDFIHFRLPYLSSNLYPQRGFFAAQLQAMVSASKIVSNDKVVDNKFAEILCIKNDPEKLDTMTVAELRTALRNVGASAKGRKQELVSALRSMINKELDGHNLSGNDEQSTDDHLTDKNVTRKHKSGKRKKNPLDFENVLLATDIKIVQQNTSGETSGLSGKTRTVKRKVTVKATFTDIEVSEGIGESAYEKEPWTRFAHKKPEKGWVAYNPRIMRPPTLTHDSKSVKLMSWNVNGLRALLKLEGFSALELAQREDFDILCLQETKLQEKDVEPVKDLLEGYDNSFWTCSVAKAGYAGTSIVSRIKPLSVKYGLGISDHDTEGRLVTAEFDSFYLLCVYVPNSGDGLRRLSYRTTEWDPSLSLYMKELEKSKPVILTGDLNCAHQEIDIYNPAGNKRSAGFTIEERESFEKNFLSKGFVDTFRKQHPDVVGYTYWGYRHGGRKFNRGWRLDYFLVSESIAHQVHDSFILPDVAGSDHCPIGLVLKQ